LNFGFTTLHGTSKSIRIYPLVIYDLYGRDTYVLFAYWESLFFSPRFEQQEEADRLLNEYPHLGQYRLQCSVTPLFFSPVSAAGRG
jgi:hypothetical protein